MSFIFRHNQVAFIKTKPYTWTPRFLSTWVWDVRLPNGVSVPGMAARRLDTGDEIVYDIFGGYDGSGGRQCTTLDLFGYKPKYYY